jgi:cation:H+ antiporter
VVQNLIVLALGVAGLTVAADRFVVGAAQVAARMRVSTVVTGALIIGFGTSAPELVVSTLAVLTEGAEGTSLAMGNIVGSNIANLTLVLAIPVLVVGRVVLEEGAKRQVAFSAVGVTVFAFFAGWGEPAIWKGIGLAALAAVALVIVIRLRDDFGGVSPPDTTQGLRPWIWTALGLVGTVGFALLVVRSATSIADTMGWTGGFVGFGLVALGTSLPELVTVLAAARRNETGLIIGNLLGSNLFNSLTVGAAVFLANGGSAYGDVARLPVWTLFAMVVVSWGLILGLIGWGKKDYRIIKVGEASILLAFYVGVLGLMVITGATV